MHMRASMHMNIHEHDGGDRFVPRFLHNLQIEDEDDA